MPPKRRTNKDLPPRVYLHGASYRFVPVDPATGRNAAPINLGRDKAAALRRWAELAGNPPAVADLTIAGLWDRYAREELPKKATATQTSAKVQARRLLAVFGAMPYAAIEPHHAVRYLDLRGRQAPIQANREVSLLRHMLTKATHWGLLARNPLLGLQYRNPEPPRDLYVTDHALGHAMDQATPRLRLLMWLAYLTGLRRKDLLALTRFNLSEAGIEVRESKTNKRVIIGWTDELRATVDEALSTSPDTRLFPVTTVAVNVAWGKLQRALAAAGHQRFQLKDLRAKHATDFDAAGGDATAQLGHSARAVTARHYLRAPRRIVPIK